MLELLKRNTQQVAQYDAEFIFENAVDIGGIKVANVPVGFIFVDPDYQRKAQGKVNRIAQYFDIEKCGFIKLSYRDGVFYAIDGQNRTLAAKQAGIKRLPSQIFIDKTSKNEALIFASQDDNKTLLTTFDKFRARLHANEKSASDIQKVCDKFNIKVRKSSAYETGVLKGLSQVESIYRMQGTKPLVWIFDTIKKSGWHNVEKGYSDLVISAMYNLYNNHIHALDNTQKLLIDIFSTTSPDILYARAVIEYIGRGRKSAMTAYIEKQLSA